MKQEKKRNPAIFRLFILLFFFVVPALFAAEIKITCSPRKASAYQGEKIILEFKITNNMVASIRPAHGYFLSYHIFNTKPGTPAGSKGKLISFDNRRFLIPKVVRRKKTTIFKCPLYFEHKNEGNYIIEFDIVKEGEFWGSKKKWQTCTLSLHLKSLFSETFKNRYLKTLITGSVPEIVSEQYLLRMIYKNNEILKDNRVFGFSPGSTYPAVWIRDMATFIAFGKLHYPLSVFERSVEIFLKNQGKDGQVVDWIDVSGAVDKNTVETDQESSLVLAAFEIVRENPGWLQKKIAGIDVTARLEMALDWVWDQKRCSEHNLIFSGFTADWGDVENTYPDKRARKLSDRSTPVFSIYTQAKYIQAVEALTGIFEKIKKPLKVRKWRNRLKTLKRQAKKILYLKDKGYFIVHIVPSKDRDKYFKMEKEILAVGGNAEAMIAGLMNREEIRKFVDILKKKRAEYNLRTVSFTLIPPYPEGFFPHHLLTHPWNYQNGGEWDWIGGRVVKGLFLNGFKKEAQKYLLEIVKKNLDNFSIFEWEDRRGTGRGALFYTGAAGVIGDAILSGYK
ncbi:hypothetical protein ACFLRB_01280 [Acidobacteriota bacterium]